MDRETLIRAILECNFAGFNNDIIDVAVKRIIECTEAEPMRHRRWVEHHEPYTWMGYTYWSCSECGFKCGYDQDTSHRSNFCPYCGARMNDVKDE